MLNFIGFLSFGIACFSIGTLFGIFAERAERKQKHFKKGIGYDYHKDHPN